MVARLVTSDGTRVTVADDKVDLFLSLGYKPRDGQDVESDESRDEPAQDEADTEVTAEATEEKADEPEPEVTPEAEPEVAPEPAKRGPGRPRKSE